MDIQNVTIKSEPEDEKVSIEYINLLSHEFSQNKEVKIEIDEISPTKIKTEKINTNIESIECKNNHVGTLYEEDTMSEDIEMKLDIGAALLQTEKETVTTSGNLDLDAYCTMTISNGGNDEIDLKSDIVDVVLNRGFNNFTYKTQLCIIKNGRPQPKMLNVNEDFSRKLTTDYYKNCHWLTGTETRNKLFCWSCVLFPKDDNKTGDTVWHIDGYSAAKNLDRFLQGHTISENHIYSQLKLKLFGKISNSNPLNEAKILLSKKHNELVKNNHSILMRLIDILVYLTSQELPLNREDSSDKGNYSDMIKLKMKYDREFNELLSNVELFNDTSTLTQNELIESICYVLNKAIEKEIESCSYFSVQIDKISKEVCCPQLSIVVRYVLNGNVYDRFLGFTDVTNNSPEHIFDIINNKLQNYDITNKLIGQTYNGSGVICSDLASLQNKIINKAPMASFAICHGDSLDLLLENACQSINKCRIFFACLSGFDSFFTNVPKRLHLLRNKTSKAEWNFKSGLALTVDTYRDQFLEVFDEILEGEAFENDYLSINEASFLEQLLNEFEFNIFLNIFKRIHIQTEIFYTETKRKVNTTALNYILTALKSSKSNDDTFMSIITDVSRIITNSEQPIKKLKPNDEMYDFYKQIYFEIIDNVSTQLETQLLNVDDLKFVELFDKANFQKFHTMEFPKLLVDILSEKYNTKINKVALENELKVLYSDPDIFGEWNDPAELYKIIYTNSLQDTVLELNTLLSIVLSLSITNTSFDETRSCLDRFKWCFENTSKDERVSSLAQLSMERDFVKQLQGTPCFYDDVIKYFATFKTRRSELIFQPI